MVLAQTRLTCDRTQALELARFFWELPQPTGQRANAAHTDGAVLLRARLDKEKKYHELWDAERCRLVVVGVEVGG